MYGRTVQRVLLLALTLGLALASLSLATAGPSASGPRALVVLPDDAAEHGTLAAHLRSKGYDVSLRTPGKARPELALERWGANQFDQLIHLAPAAAASSASAGDLSPQSVVAFLRRGGNAVFAFDQSASDAWRDFAHEFHVSFLPRGHDTLVDHFRAVENSSEEEEQPHTTILVGGTGKGGASASLSPGGVVPHHSIFTPSTLETLRTDPIIFRGIGHTVSDLPLGFPLLLAPGTTYSSSPEEKENVLVGPEAILASAFQLKDVSSRVLFLGSTEMLKDSALTAKQLQTRTGERLPQSGNLAFLSDALSWTMQERNVLRAVSTSHHRVRSSDSDLRPYYEEDAEGSEASMYRINDTVQFSLDVQTFVPYQGWKPAPRDLHDVQVSLTMLDPYETVTLAPLPDPVPVDSLGKSQERDVSSSASSAAVTAGVSSAGEATRFTAQVRLPDRHGVFTFVVDWKRQGFTYLFTKDVAPVRPYNSDEHPRWLSAAYPYAVGALSTMGAFLAFTALWLFTPYTEVVPSGKEKSL